MDEAKVIEGSQAVARAVKLCQPDVISAYPISPQTHIVENLAQMAADGELKSEMILVESEFSAASAVTGASAAGGRAYTASSSQGLLLMTEVIYNAAGMIDSGCCAENHRFLKLFGKVKSIRDHVFGILNR